MGGFIVNSFIAKVEMSPPQIILYILDDPLLQLSLANLFEGLCTNSLWVELFASPNVKV